jgi:hypothetical protein
MVQAAGQETAATVEGIVTRIGTDVPAEDIQVILHSARGPRAGTTGPDGRFRITDVPPGQSFITASGRGFMKPRRQSGPASLMLSPGEHRKDVRLRVQATSVISGRVLDENRRPRSGMAVLLLRYTYEDGRRLLAPSGVVPSQFFTDDRGEYRIFDLEPDDYIVAVLPAGLGGVPQGSAVYYPGVTDLRLAVSVSALPGAEAAGIDFALARTTVYSARFKVPGFSTGTLMTRPIPRGIPALHEALSNLPGGCARESGEVWVCNLVPGEYDIFARTLPGSGQESARFGRIFARVVDRNVDAPPLSLNPRVMIRGRIVVPEELQSRVILPELNVVLSRVLPAAVWFSSQSDDSSGVQADGTFRLDAFEGEYRVHVFGLPGEVYLEGASYAARNVLDTGMTVERDSQGALELVLSGPAGTLEGDIRTAAGDAVANGAVVLVPVGSRRDDPEAYHAAIADANGAFSVRGLRPGEYSVLGWEEVEYGALQNRAFVERFEQRAVKISVGRGEVRRVSLVAIREN